MTAPSRETITWSTPAGFCQLNCTLPSRGVAPRLRTSAGAFGAGGMGSGEAGVPAGGCGRMVRATSLKLVFPLASLAENLMVRVPTGRKDGALFVTTGLPSTRSVADAAERNETTVETVLGIPVGVVA